MSKLKNERNAKLVGVLLGSSNHKENQIASTPKNKGITLIALIITIIVMLILVAVTINVVLDTGLFGIAKEASRGTTVEKVKEQIIADITAKIAEKQGENITEDELKAIVAPKYGTLDETGTILKLTEGGYEVPLNEIWQVGTTKTLSSLYCEIEGCENEEHIHKGDYVSYNPITDKTSYAPDKGEGIGKYTGYTEGSEEQNITKETLNWRVLGKNEAGEILLISGAPTEAGLTFYGHVGYNNYEDVLNNTCKTLYSNSQIGAEARSITMEDIDKYLGGSNFNKEEFGGGSSTEGGYGYQATISSIFDYDETANKLTKLEEAKNLNLTSNAYMYEATNELIGEKNREILLGKEAENTYYMWVASRAVYVYSGGARWCMDYAYVGLVDASFGLCDSGDELVLALCLRPVVSLPSNVTIDDVPKKAETVTETWNDQLGMY